MDDKDVYDGPVPDPWDTGLANLTGGSEAVLDEVRAWLARFIIAMDDTDLDLLALWAAHTHLCTVLYTSPRLIIDSPVPGSGKTTVLEHLGRLCVAPVQAASLGSSALLARIVDARLRTVLIDEADRSLHPKKEGVSELLAIINSGYKRGATRPVLVSTQGGDWVEKEMKTFAPIAMAGNAPQLPEDTASRSIRVLLMPDVNDDAEESDWELIEDDAILLGARLAHWCDQISEEVSKSRPPLPAEVKGRSRERWSPLKRIAVIAGGHWPQLVDELALREHELLQMDRDDGVIRDRPHMILVRHMYEVWPEGQEFFATKDITKELAQTYPDTWGEASPFGKAITPQRLGRMLASNFKIHSSRLSATTPRGYTRTAMKRAWDALQLGSEPDA